MSSVFTTASFIKPNIVFDPAYNEKNPAPLFRKRFSAKRGNRTVLSVCGLGYAYCYLNGRLVSEDLFCAPVGHYEKTLWYVEYDVSELMLDGENALTVICGNGWFNEEFRSAWDFETASWRDLPKVILQLKTDGKTVLVSDESWKCRPESAIVFNALRSGEHFDSRLYEESLISVDYDDSDWDYAVRDDRAPGGIFRKCTCEPIRESEVFGVRQWWCIGPKRYVFDMGQNISGYIRLHAKGTAGKTYFIRYAEMCREDHSLANDRLSRFFSESPFQTDVFICSGKEMVWSPRFAYHGFRYIEIEGIDSPDEVGVEAVFVHQAVPARTEFACSDEILTRLFSAGRYSCYSNMFYLLSDCPTREKLGWTNDAHMSAEQLLTDFEIERLLKKWLIDIYDAMREDGALPGIVPTPGWGYHWGNGPLADGALFELPYRIWLHTADMLPLVESLPYFERYLSYLKTQEDPNGWVAFGLGDWATAGNRDDIPVPFVNAVLIEKFCRIAALAASLAGDTDLQTNYDRQALHWREKLLSAYLEPNGRCKLNKQAAVAILIYHGLYHRLEPLKGQLQELVLERDYHHDCGILGLRCLFEALNMCGLQEYAYRILHAAGIPSFCYWLEQGATTLWEWWAMYPPSGEYNSRNHHMHSNFMSWIIKTVLGITHDKTAVGLPELSVAPFFFEGLEWAEGSYRIDGGSLSVHWERMEGKIKLCLSLTDDCAVLYQGAVLRAGEYHFIIEEANKGEFQHENDCK